MLISLERVALIRFPPVESTELSIETRGVSCLAVLECILDFFRALSTGSCLSSDGGGGRSSLGPSSLGAASPALGSQKGKKAGRRQSSSLYSSVESNRGDDQFISFPGRMFLNGESKIASLFSQQGKKGINQDAMILWEVNLLQDSPSFSFFVWNSFSYLQVVLLSISFCLC